ncbi:hypothetical protein SH580_15320 [Coraliomargarita algicola]|uniref:Uncharacterized protein n=1 Tax=Coraliomargarita algicola TaxID=3092156 RepID=A0ABZ0RFK4_9BACT|nr:hypothetical protein [Coraliomargarita sp. J2-16]WPJ94802.1 hypothetical protein SH580_15320 [Coraliomargarita sp. J2-16]
MKSPPLLALPLLLCLSLSLTASPIQTGHSTEQVIEKLGKPIGTIELREKALLLYPQGEITLKHGLVTEVELMSEAEFEADQERLRLEREKWVLDQERRRAARTQEGEAIRSEKMTSRAFTALPAKDRVDYWRSFQIRYPSVDVSEQIATALASYQTELEELRSQQKIAELEARVAQAEKEAAAARLEAEKLRKETENQRRSANYGLRYYTDPVITNPRYYYRPPKVTIYTYDKESPRQRDRDKQPMRNAPFSQQGETVAERAQRILNPTND